MNAKLIGGEKPVVNAAKDYAGSPSPFDNRSFIVGYRETPDVVIERVLRGEDTNDLDLLVTNFVMILKGIGFDVNLAVNGDGDLVIEENSEFSEVGDELEAEDRPLQVGDKVEVSSDCEDKHIRGMLGTVLCLEDDMALVKYPGCINGHGDNYDEWWTDMGCLSRATTH